MATLTETSDFVKKSFGFFVLGIILIFVLVLGLPAFLKSLKPKEQPQTPKPEASFGKLPKVEFPESEKYPDFITLENIEGRPPEATTSAKVYFVPVESINLFSRRDAINFAAKFDFTSDPQEVSTTLYHFSEPGREFSLDITNHNFTLKTDFLAKNIPEKNINLEAPDAAAVARSYLGSGGNFNQTLSKNKAAYIYYDGQNFTEVEKTEEANLVRVDFFHDDLGNYPILTGRYNKSSVYAIFTQAEKNKNEFIEASYQHFPPNLTVDSTYPLISSKQAWDDLKNRKGFIAKAVFGGNEAVVRNIYLAYLETGKYQPYIQPVFVFEGDKGFVGMVPAIDPAWVGN